MSSGASGAGPKVDDTETIGIFGLDGKDQAPPLLHAELLDLQTGDRIIEEVVLFAQAKPPVGLVPPVTVLPQLDRDPQPHSYDWSQSLRIYRSVVKYWWF